MGQPAPSCRGPEPGGASRLQQAGIGTAVPTGDGPADPSGQDGGTCKCEVGVEAQDFEIQLAKLPFALHLLGYDAGGVRPVVVLESAVRFQDDAVIR